MNSGLRLGLITAVAALAVAVVFTATRERIAEQERRAELASLQAVLPPQLYDNDPLTDTLAVSAPQWLGSEETRLIYRARLAGKPSALVIRSTAPNGYNGPIELLVGIDYRGQLTDVRVISHRETPGLADGIDHEVSDWIEQFAGRSLRQPPPEQWTVRKDGGSFDAFTGATITPRAVVQAIRRTLEFHQLHRDALYAGDVAAASAEDQKQQTTD